MTTPPPSEGPKHKPWCVTVPREFDSFNGTDPCKFKCDCGAVSAKPSEGPSPEMERLIDETLVRLGLHDPRVSRERREILRGVVQAAKRSAHLEDAQAGCWFCGGNRDDYEAVPVKREGRTVWHHKGCHETTLGAWWKCERPEVWDALSLPPGGQK